MNAYYHKNIVLQLMPPHWREDSWRVAMLLSLSCWVEKCYRQLLALDNSLRNDINLSPQVGVLEGYLCRVLGVNNRVLFFSESNNAGEFIINVTGEAKTMISEIEQLLQSKMALGTRYNIIEF